MHNAFFRFPLWHPVIFPSQYAELIAIKCLDLVCLLAIRPSLSTRLTLCSVVL